MATKKRNSGAQRSRKGSLNITMPRSPLRSLKKELKRGKSDHDGLGDDEIANFELGVMQRAESEQVNKDIDTFWGLDEEARRCAVECSLMIQEHDNSVAWEAYMRQRSLIAQWDQEDTQAKYNEAFNLAIVEDAARKQYIKHLHSAVSTREIMNYRWPTRHFIEPAPVPARQKTKGARGGLSQVWEDSVIYQPTYDENTEEMLFGIMHIDNNSASVVHGESLQKTKSIEAQFEEDAELAAMVLKGKSVGTNITERAMFPRAKPKDSSHGGGLEQSLGRFQTRPNVNAESADKRSDVTLQDNMAASLVMAGQVLPHVDELDGHPTYKWDQEMILTAAFGLLTPENSSHLSLANFIERMNDETVQDLLKFTIFGAWIKLRQWHMFETIFGGAGVEDSDEDISVGQMTLSLEGWLQAARAAASEEGVLAQHIRTQDEHKTIIKSSGPWMKILGVGNKAWFADRAREGVYRTSREAYLARRLNRGDFVWGLYGASCVWLPATVQRANEDGTFDLSYPLSSRGLQDARVLASSKELLNLPSMEPKSREYNPRPGDDEYAAVSHAFDLLDMERNGAVEPQQMLSALKSEQFEKIVKSSAALYLIFGTLAGTESLEKNLVDTCTKLSGNGLIDKETFVEYCMIATDLSTFNTEVALME